MGGTDYFFLRVRDFDPPQGRFHYYLILLHESLVEDL